jgi:cellobiose-specific phosphotransferase system component IIB
MRRAHRESLADYWLSCFGFYPVICENCRGRMFGLRLRKMALVLSAGIAASALIGAGLGQIHRRGHERRIERAAADSSPSAAEYIEASAAAVAPQFAITNADIVELTQAGMTSKLICKLIHSTAHRFQIGPKSLVDLKRAGVSEDVMLAMLESTPALTDAAAADRLAPNLTVRTPSVVAQPLPAPSLLRIARAAMVGTADAQPAGPMR